MRQETIDRLSRLKLFIDEYTPLTHTDDYHSDEVYEVCEWALATWNNVSVAWKRDSEVARIALLFHHFTDKPEGDE
jgi:hypothetical protein